MRLTEQLYRFWSRQDPAFGLVYIQLPPDWSAVDDIYAYEKRFGRKKNFEEDALARVDKSQRNTERILIETFGYFFRKQDEPLPAGADLFTASGMIQNIRLLIHKQTSYVRHVEKLERLLAQCDYYQVAYTRVIINRPSGEKHRWLYLLVMLDDCLWFTASELKRGMCSMFNDFKFDSHGFKPMPKGPSVRGPAARKPEPLPDLPGSINVKALHECWLAWKERLPSTEPPGFITTRSKPGAEPGAGQH